LAHEGRSDIDLAADANLDEENASSLLAVSSLCLFLEARVF